MRVVGQHQLAVAGADVGEQRLAAAGGVEPDHDVAAERGRGQRHRHLGGVVEQDADVRRPVGVEQRAERVGAGRGLGDVLGPGPGAVAARQPGPRRRRARARSSSRSVVTRGSAASDRPTWSACSVAPPYANSKRLAVVK